MIMIEALKCPWHGQSGSLMEKTDEFVRLWHGRHDTLMEQTDELTCLWNGWSDALTEQTDELMRLWTDEATLWRNGNPAELARALRIYWWTWLCQLRMTDETLTNYVELRWCFKRLKRRTRDRCTRNRTGLRGLYWYVGQPLWGEEWINRRVKEGRSGKARECVGCAAMESRNSKAITSENEIKLRMQRTKYVVQIRVA